MQSRWKQSALPVLWVGALVHELAGGAAAGQSIPAAPGPGAAAEESSEAPDPGVVARVTASYEEGMAHLRGGRPDDAIRQFDDISTYLEKLDGPGIYALVPAEVRSDFYRGRWSMFVQRADGRWAFRQDALTAMYARALLRKGIVNAARHSSKRALLEAQTDICTALLSNRRAAYAEFQRTWLSPRAKAVFENAHRSCSGRRSWKERPVFVHMEEFLH
jgi:hypothetical protein